MYYTKLKNPKEYRKQLKNQMDKFTSFKWGPYDMYDEFGVFIINEKQGGLKMYNGPSFSNNYTKAQFSSEGNILSGVNFNIQTLEFTVGVYYITIAEYRRLLDVLNPYIVDNLTFSYNPEWHYQVKLKNISDSPKHIVDSEIVQGHNKEFIEYYYYTELKLTFEIQGTPCLYANKEYVWENETVDFNDERFLNKHKLADVEDNYHEGDLSFHSDLDFPFDIKIPFRPLVANNYLRPTNKTFIDRVSPIELDQGYRVVEQIGGNTIVFNQVAEFKQDKVYLRDEPDFKVYIENGNITIKGSPKEFTTIGGYYPEKAFATLNVIEGHKYLYIGGDYNFSFSTIYAGVDLDGQLETTLNENHQQVIATAQSNVKLRLLIGVSPNSTPYDTEIKLRMIDLTQCYGEGNEPDNINDNRINNLKAILAEKPDYNEGELISAKPTTFTSIGTNLCDQELIIGSIGENGEDDGNPNVRRTKYIKVVGGKKFSCRPFGDILQTQAEYDFIFAYDSDKKFITKLYGGNISQNEYYAVDLPEDTRYVRASFTNIGDFVSTNPMIFATISDQVPTEYKPYVVDTLKTEYAKYFTRTISTWDKDQGKFVDKDIVGMLGVAVKQGEKVFTSARDLLTSKYARQVMGVVDLGTLTWSKLNNNTIYASGINGLGDNKYNDKSNMICSRYQNVSANTIENAPSGKMIAHAGIGAIKIYDSDLFKLPQDQIAGALSGVLLVYELKEPIENPIEPALNLVSPVQKGGIESWDSEVPVYTEAFYASFINNKRMGAELSIIIDRKDKEHPEREPLEIPLMHCQLSNLTQTLNDIDDQDNIPRILADTFYIHYYSDSGIVLYSKGDATDTLLTLMSSGSNGKRLVEVLETHRFMFEKNTDLSKCHIKIQLTNAEFDMSGDIPNIEINSSARTSIA